MDDSTLVNLKYGKLMLMATYVRSSSVTSQYSFIATSCCTNCSGHSYNAHPQLNNGHYYIATPLARLLYLDLGAFLKFLSLH